MRVAVYFNLHKNIFSIQSRDKENYGKVIDHRESVVLQAPTFVVRQAGRKQTIRENKKNVHAFVVGWLTEGVRSTNPEYDVTYNPYKHDGFVDKERGTPVKSAAFAVLRMGYKGKPMIHAYGGMR